MKSAAAVALIILASFPNQVSVLCIAPGHVAIESLDSPCCVSPAAAAGTSAPGIQAGDACGDCVDVLLSDGEVLPGHQLCLAAPAAAQAPETAGLPATRSHFCSANGRPAHLSGVPLRC